MNERLKAIAEKAKDTIKFGYVSGRHWLELGDPAAHIEQTTKFAFEERKNLEGTDAEFSVITVKVGYDPQFVSPWLDADAFGALFSDSHKAQTKRAVRIGFECNPHGGPTNADITGIGEVDGIFCHVRIVLGSAVP